MDGGGYEVVTSKFECNRWLICKRLEERGHRKRDSQSTLCGERIEGKMKPFIVHNTPALRQTSNKVIISCACLLGFRLCLLDITQAYLQSKDNLTRAVFIKPKQDRPYLKVRPDEVLQLIKPLYDMCDSGDYWGATH